MSSGILISSFGDPSGFLFVRDGTHCRQVNKSYQTHYERLIGSGLSDELTRDGVPLNLTGSLLPFSSKLKFSLFTHTHIRSKAQHKYANKEVKKDSEKVSGTRANFISHEKEGRI